jgi:hypothetical protein
MANFNEDVSITGTLTIMRSLQQTGIEVQSVENIPNGGVHINTINSGGNSPYVLAVAVGPGMQGESLTDTGVTGRSQSGFGVLAQSSSNSGLVATSSNGQAISAFSDNNIGVFVKGATFAAVLNGAVVVNKGDNPKDPNIPPSDINGCIVINEGSLFLNKGDINVSGNITMRNAGDVILADCAEEFQCSIHSGLIDAGSVVALDEEGEIRPCSKGYDKKAVGVVSGAGPFRPAIVLDRRESVAERAPIALVGKVCCKVDAQFGPIAVGDLLTTSSTSGHAMKASDPLNAFGAVIGKALQPWPAGQGLIPILVALQ